MTWRQEILLSRMRIMMANECHWINTKFVMFIVGNKCECLSKKMQPHQNGSGAAVHITKTVGSYKVSGCVVCSQQTYGHSLWGQMHTGVHTENYLLPVMCERKMWTGIMWMRSTEWQDYNRFSILMVKTFWQNNVLLRHNAHWIYAAARLNGQ